MSLPFAQLEGELMGKIKTCEDSPPRKSHVYLCVEFVQLCCSESILFSRFGITKSGELRITPEQQILFRFKFTCRSNYGILEIGIWYRHAEKRESSPALRNTMPLYRVGHSVHNKPCAKHSHRYHRKIPSAVSPPGCTPCSVFLCVRPLHVCNVA